MPSRQPSIFQTAGFPAHKISPNGDRQQALATSSSRLPVSCHQRPSHECRSRAWPAHATPGKYTQYHGLIHGEIVNDVGIDIDVDIDMDIGIEVDFSFDVDIDVDFKVGTNIEADIDVDTDINVDIDIDIALVYELCTQSLSN
jgi:hypothetical protein